METVESDGPVIRVFGGAGLAINGEAVGIGGPRQRRLLALLAIRAGEVIDNDWLSEYVWNDRDRPDVTTPALRTYVSRLRSSFPAAIRSWVVTEQAGYRLAAPDEALEHRAFVALRTRGRRAREGGDPATAQRMLDQALDMWRGEPFRELEDLDWAQAEISRLRLDRLELLEERWEVALALGRHTQITGELAAFTAEHGLRERAVRQYALALHRSGRSTEALRVIDDHRRVVADLSGLEPSSELAELEDAILTGDPAVAQLEEGTPLRGYRLLEQVGSGAFSVVWRGLQPSIERLVAVKQIRSELAAQPDFIRRFEVEAQTVARIEHPHIVPLIDFWRDPDAAYLVMRWLPGGTLERLLDDGPLSIEQTVAIIEQIGGALEAAHSHDVIHRDVKPANVMFDSLGNAFLTDFGIALTAAESSGPAAALSVGSPAYASPEQLRREPLTPASDVFSLGVVAYECVAGSLPFSDTSNAGELLARQLGEVASPLRGTRPEVPEHIETAVSRAMSKNPADRFDSVREFVEQCLSQRQARPRASPVSTDNPYLGLRPFDQTDSARFFGRRRLVSELVTRLSSDDQGSKALVLVGPSGSGKSSVVRAGLLPAVRSGEIPGSDAWFVTTMVPGGDPYESLEAALLRVAVNPPASLLEQLRDGPRGVLRGVRRCVPGDDQTILLVIDQFEELFVGQAAPLAAAFLDAVTVAVDDPTGPLRLVGTLRADYYHRPLEHPAFAPILKRGAVEVTPLAPDELEEAILGPAGLAGVSFEPGLVARVAADTIGQPSPLPLLQHLLAELFERRSGNMLTVEAYDELGGLSGALAERAEAIYRSADADQRATIRRVFGRLTDPGADRADLRRRMLRSTLGDEPDVRWVLERFGAARLLTFDRDSASREPTVEVAHEALLREWPRLVGWLEEDRDLLRSIDALSMSATVWNDDDRRPSDLLRGPRHMAALDLMTSAPQRLGSLEREFIDASQALANHERHAERKRVRRLRALNVSVSVALVIALIAGAVALIQRGEAVSASIEAEQATDAAQAAANDAVAAQAVADDARAEAELAALISRSEALVDQQPDLAVLLALEAHRRAPGPTTQRVVLDAVSSAPGRVTSLSLPEQDTALCPAFDRGMAVAADGSTGFLSLDGRLISIDLTSGVVSDRGPAPARCVRWIGDEDMDVRWVTEVSTEASPTFTRVWTGSWSGPLTQVAIDRAGDFLDRSLVGDRILFDASSFELLVVDASTGEEVTRVSSTVGGTTLAPYYDRRGGNVWAVGDAGRFIVFGLDSVFLGLDLDRVIARGGLVVMDGRTGEKWHSISLANLPTAISVHGDKALVGGLFGRVTAVDLESGETLSDVATSSSSAIVATGIRPDGLAVAVAEDRIDVVDLQTGAVDSTIRIDVGSAVVRPDGVVVVLDADQRTVTLVETRLAGIAEQVIDIPPDSVVGFGSRRVAVVHGPGEVELIDLDAGARSIVDTAVGAPDFGPIAAFPTEDGFVAFGRGAELARWRGPDLVQRQRLQLEFGAYGDFTPSAFVNAESAPGPTHAANGAVVVLPNSRDWLPEVYLVDWTDGVLDTRLIETSFQALTAVSSGDGGVHVMDGSGRIRSYDTDGRWMAETTTGLRYAFEMARSENGLIAAGGIGGAVIVDPASATVHTIEGIGGVNALAFADGGRILVTIEDDGTVRLSDAASGASVGTLARGSGRSTASMPWFDTERRTVWVAASDRLMEFSLDPERWIEQACAFVGRDLTRDEWDSLVPGEEPLQSACP